jgi:hypothetical protein
MRILIAIPALLALGACNVSKDGNAVTVQYDQNPAENAVAEVSNTAGNVAEDIGNSVENTSDKVENRLDNGDSDANAQANATENQ